MDKKERKWCFVKAFCALKDKPTKWFPYETNLAPNETKDECIERVKKTNPCHIFRDFSFEEES